MKHHNLLQFLLLLSILLFMDGCSTPSGQPPPTHPGLPTQPESPAFAQISQLRSQPRSDMEDGIGCMATISFDSIEHIVTWKTDSISCFRGSITNRGDTLKDYFLALNGGDSQHAKWWGMELIVPVQAAKRGAILWNNTIEKSWLLRIHNQYFHAFSADSLPIFLQIDEWESKGRIVTGRLSGMLDDALSEKKVWVKSLFFRTNWCLDSLYMRMERQD